MTYPEKLKDPRWQKLRLEVMERDAFTCTWCGDKTQTLNVHHLAYHRDPWDSPPDELVTLCEDCHSIVEELKKSIQLKLGVKRLRCCFQRLNELLEEDNKIVENLCDFFYFLSRDRGFQNAVASLIIMCRNHCAAESETIPEPAPPEAASTEAVHPNLRPSHLREKLTEAVSHASMFTASYLRICPAIFLKDNTLTIKTDHIGLMDNSKNVALLKLKMAELGYANIGIQFVCTT